MTTDDSRELVEIRELMKSDPQGYWSDPHLQQRHGELLSAREAGARAPVDDRVEAEIAELRRLAGDDSSPYWNGPRATELQARYAELIAVRDGFPAAEPIHAAADVQGRADRMEATINGLLDDVDDPGGLEASFYDDLPAPAQDAIRAELAQPPPDVNAAPPEAVAAFMSRPEGSALAHEWGDRTPRNVAVFHARLARVLATMSRSDQAAAIAWAETLRTDKAAAVARALTR